MLQLLLHTAQASGSKLSSSKASNDLTLQPGTYEEASPLKSRWLIPHHHLMSPLLWGSHIGWTGCNKLPSPTWDAAPAPKCSKGPVLAGSQHTYLFALLNLSLEVEL